MITTRQVAVSSARFTSGDLIQQLIEAFAAGCYYVLTERNGSLPK